MKDKDALPSYQAISPNIPTEIDTKDLVYETPTQEYWDSLAS